MHTAVKPSPILLARRFVPWALLWIVLGTLAACSGGDGGGGGGTSGVVTPPPAAAADSYSTGTGQATLTVSSPGVLTNDTGTGLTAEKVSGPVHAASFTLNADGSFTYVHDNSSVTTDSFTYRATNSGGASPPATVSITITPPVAAADTYGIAVPGGTLNAPGIGVLANDTGTGLTAELLSAPAHYSSFTLNPNGSFTYVNDGSPATTDSFTYRAKGGGIVSNTATVTININQPPVASNFCDTTPAGQNLAVSFSGHVTDPNAGDTVTCKLGSTTPLKGQVSDAGGSCTYMPRVDLPSGDNKARGVDKFSIRAVDSQGLQSNEIIVTVLIDGKVRIMPVGDSITEGTFGSSGLPPPGEMISFRKNLYVDLTAGGYPIDFVGTQSEGFGGNPPVWPNGDYDHEGHPGWRDDEIANGTTYVPYQDPNCPTCNITDWLNSKQPDIVLLHIGTNGVNDPGGTSATDVQTILNKIDTWETANGSPITVYLARIIGSPDSTRNANTTTFNNNVTSMAQIRITNGDKIVVVDLQNGAGLNYSTDMADNLHPNQGGYDKMANKWKNDMLSSGVLPNCP